MKKIIIQKGLFLDKIAYIKDDILKKLKITDKNQPYFEKDIFIAKKKKQNISMSSLSLSLDENTDGFMHYYGKDNFEYKLCQIKKIYNNEKNPKLTDEITLVGKYIIYIKGSSGLSISNKSKDDEIIETFKNAINPSILSDTKIILRSNCTKDDIHSAISETEEFDKIYSQIKLKAKLTSKPQLLYRQYESEELFLSKLNTDIDELIINDKQTADRLKRSSFKIDNIICKNENLFEKNLINTQIDALLSDKISMQNGINLYIQKTEAMYVIDVNSAGYFKYKDKNKNAHHINSIAIPEIAKQIMLRDLSGIILIDFIEMNDDKLAKNLINQMNTQLENDDRKSSVVSITKLSLMQIIRKKEDLSISEILLDKNFTKLYSVEYIFEQISEKLSNMQITDEENLEQIKSVNIHIPTFESEKTNKYIKILEEKYNIKIIPDYLKRSDFNIKIH